MFTIAVDFDGTCVDHAFPALGADVPGAAAWLRAFIAAGARVVLWTMRSDGPPRDPGETPLGDAVSWFYARGISLYGINANPAQCAWTSSPKAFAHVYIDDAAACCPLRANPRGGGRPYVDWDTVGPAVLALVEAHGR